MFVLVKEKKKIKAKDTGQYIVAKILTEKLLTEHWITYKEFETIDKKNKKCCNKN